MSATTVPWLAEAAVTLTLNYIQDNISAALDEVATVRGDSPSSLESPKEYFIYPTSYNYRTPAVFAICEQFNFNQDSTGANHINAKVRLNISVVVEERDQSRLVYKCWRYQSAIHELLAGATLQSTAQDVVLTVVIANESFSPMYSAAKDQRSTEALFRKEVLFECEVIQRENF